jgi:hypothetical protein
MAALPGVKYWGYCVTGGIMNIMRARQIRAALKIDYGVMTPGV